MFDPEVTLQPQIFPTCGEQIRTVTVFSEIPTLDFDLPPELEAGEPPEARGLKRDEVRLMVSFLSDSRIVHTCFRRLPEYLEAGDVLVINTSGTLNAALRATRKDGEPVELHLSTRLPAGLWVIELRRLAPEGSTVFYSGQPGERISLPGGGQATLLAPYREDQRGPSGQIAARDAKVRLWIAALGLPCPMGDYLEQYGFPIRYKYVRDAWPSATYQTVYATEKGSAEMPSAGRAFSPPLITELVANGVQVSPLLLHTGVASLEEHEPPYEEYYQVPAETAYVVNAARSRGKRVIAVGTTSVRALETVAGPDGKVSPGEGWTNRIITPESGLHAVDGMLTGLHEPRSTHLGMLEALAGRQHLRKTYGEALHQGYLWHEFGDLHLILP